MEQLSSALDIPRYAAVGILATLWDWAGRFTPRGDIGKYSNLVIARKIGWTENPDSLINALVETGWLEEAEDEVRLYIHDWHEHCEDWVHAHLARHTQTFAIGEMPKLSKLSQKERDEAKERYRQKAEEAKLAAANGSQRQPAKPNQTKPGPNPLPRDPAPESTGLALVPGEEEGPDPQLIADKLATELHARHPEPCSLPLAKKAAARALFRYKDQDPQKIAAAMIETHRAHCELWALRRAENPNSYVPHVHVWLEEERYLQKGSIPIKIRGHPRDKKQAAREQFDRLVMRDLEDAKQQKIHRR